MNAIVTGGASGMGESICHALAKEGASVAIVDINLRGAKSVESDIRKYGSKAVAIKADVQSPEELKAMSDSAVDLFGSINVLVNNAGARIIKKFLEHTEQDWNTMLNINLSGSFFCSQAVVPNMIASGGGSIINVCSIASYMGRPNRCAYVAAKSGLLGLTRTMAIDLASENIRVNGISPGMIASPFNQKFFESDDTGSTWQRDNLVGRWGKPSDVDGAVVFLASEESSFVTGSDIKVEGGWLAARARVGEDKITSD